MKMMIVLNHDEVQRDIPYAVVCETRYGSRWNTMKRRRLWAQMFTEAERKAAHELFQMALLWYLDMGVPNEVKMTIGTYKLWGRLGEFCASL